MSLHAQRGAEIPYLDQYKMMWLGLLILHDQSSQSDGHNLPWSTIEIFQLPSTNPVCTNFNILEIFSKTCSCNLGGGLRGP